MPVDFPLKGASKNTENDHKFREPLSGQTDCRVATLARTRSARAGGAPYSAVSAPPLSGDPPAFRPSGLAPLSPTAGRSGFLNLPEAHPEELRQCRANRR